MAPVPSAVLERLRDACSRAFPMRLAVLFGSRAKGAAREGSDFDVGVLPIDPGVPLKHELALASALSGITGTEVDLVRLDRDDPLLGREIAESGQCLFESAPGAFAAYRAEAMSRWADFDETIAPHRARMLARLAQRAR